MTQANREGMGGHGWAGIVWLLLLSVQLLLSGDRLQLSGIYDWFRAGY